METQSQAAPQFGAGRALGFFIEVFRARPASFAVLSVLHLLVYAGGSLAMLMPLAFYGEEFISLTADPQADAGALFTGLYNYMGLSSAASLVFGALAVWIEAVWLRMMTRGEASVLPRAGDYGRVLLAFIVIFAIVFGVYIAGFFLVAVPVFIAAAFEQILVAVMLGAVGGIGLLVSIVWLGVRLSPLAALCVLERRFALGQTFSGSGRIFWPLLGAWFVWLLIYFALALVALLVVWAMPGVYSQAVSAGLDPFADPAAQMNGYAALVSGPGALASAMIGLGVTMAIYLPACWIQRGIACRAALDIAGAATPASSHTGANGAEVSAGIEHDAKPDRPGPEGNAGKSGDAGGDGGGDGGD